MIPARGRLVSVVDCADETLESGRVRGCDGSVSCNRLYQGHTPGISSIRHCGVEDKLAKGPKYSLVGAHEALLVPFCCIAETPASRPICPKSPCRRLLADEASKCK